MFSQYSKPNLFGSGVHRLQRYTLETNWQGPLDLEFYCFVRHFLFLFIFPSTFRADVQAKIAQISHHSLLGQNCKNLALSSFWQKSQAPNGAIFKKDSDATLHIFLAHYKIRHKFSFACFGGTSCENLSNSSLCCKNLVYPSKYKMARERSPTEDVMVVIVVRWFTHDVYNLLRSRRS